MDDLESEFRDLKEGILYTEKNSRSTSFEFGPKEETG